MKSKAGTRSLNWVVEFPGYIEKMNAELDNFLHGWESD